MFKALLLDNAPAFAAAIQSIDPARLPAGDVMVTGATGGVGSVARLQNFFNTLDAQLASCNTVVASGFSLCDITAAVAVDFARIVRVKPGDEHANLRRWREAMPQRPAFQL